MGGPNLDLEDGILMNAMFFMYDGEVRGGVNKTILSDYDVFDESRYFIPENPTRPTLQEPEYPGNLRRVRIQHDREDRHDHRIGSTPGKFCGLSYIAL